MRAGRGALPWYVGKASKQALSKEAFALHKFMIYNEVLVDRAGTPLLTLVMFSRTPGSVPMTAIDDVEEYLIAWASARNSLVANKRRLPSQTWEIAGVEPAGRGAPSEQARAFKQLMGIRKSRAA